MPNNVATHLDWNLPLLPAITQQLLAGADGDFIDLSSVLVIVPTVQSGRRLREALALAANDRGLFPPDIVTPDVFLGQAIKNEPIANEETVTAAWFTVLGAIDCTQFEALFPITPQQNTTWQLGMAQRLMQLRNELGEEGLDFALAAQRTAESGHEPARWGELARLEGLYLDQLQIRSLKDPKLARREAAQNYLAPAQVQRIILAATPDPQPLPLQALERAAESIPVEVWIYGPEDASFDSWGRPITEYWTQRPLDFEAWDCHLQTLAAPKPTAAWITKTMQGAAPESVLLGLADTTLNPIVVDALSRAGIASYDPEGQPLHIGGVGRLTELLCQLCDDRSTPTIRTLLQHPDIQEWLNIARSSNELLRQLDRLFEDHLAPDLNTLIYFAKRKTNPELHDTLSQLDRLAADLVTTKHFPTALAQALQQIYADKQIEASAQSDVPWKERADAIRKLLNDAAEADSLFPKLPKDFSRSAFRQNLQRSRVYPDRPREAHDLLGWLELLWNDAPHLILAGLNEGIVPESIVGDAFLPEALREQLGLRTNAQRFARDAYLLEALCRRRTGDQGRIDILVPQAADDHKPLKPSRLLFLGHPETLLPRTRQLFKETEDTSVDIEHSAAWKLTPPLGLPLPESISVSAFKNYLECPFRFFLRHILKMRTIDVETRELNPAAFGNLVHDTVAELNGSTLDSATDQAALVKKLHSIAEQMLKHRYGDKLSFALRLQHEALMSRVIAFCEHQTEDIATNGSITIMDTEEPFEIPLNGFTIKGRIDRIDQRGERLELIDYKTSNSPVNPEKAHLAVVAKKAPPKHLPEEAFFDHEGKTYRWTDLQLPLYVLAKRGSGSERHSVAYFNLGQTIEKSGIERWEGLTDSHLDSARACAQAVIEKIKAGIFWPPNQDVHEAYDDFAALFPDGIENSVDAEAFMGYRFNTNSSTA
ncbi:MAG: ATP-dependent helicase/nuclease subunit B [Lentimonas sp.]|jgi:ATP-dependent helicase/nuclease subunit B